MPTYVLTNKNEFNPFEIHRRVSRLYKKQNENVGVYATPAKDADKFDVFIALNDELESELRKFTSTFSDNLSDLDLTGRVRSGQMTDKLREGSAYAGNIGTGKILSLLAQGNRMLKKLSFQALSPSDIDTLQQQYGDLQQYMNLKDDLSQLESTADASLETLEDRKRQALARADAIPSGVDRKREKDRILKDFNEEDTANDVISSGTATLVNTVGSFYSQLEQYLMIFNNKLTNYNTNPASAPPMVELGGGFRIGDQRYYGNQPRII
jgi:hypothetical protein